MCIILSKIVQYEKKKEPWNSNFYKPGKVGYACQKDRIGGKLGVHCITKSREEGISREQNGGC